MTKRYPLHHEYDRLVKAEQELKKLQKKLFDNPAIRWHIVATEGDPPKTGRYFTIREDRTGMWVNDSYYGKKSWYKGLKVVAWLSRQEMLEAGIDAISKDRL